ncbi:hypothetical protein D3C80_2143430 [compost metagenome]
MLHADVKKRGVMVKYDNGGGQAGYKKNDCIAEMVKVSAQMLKILSELNLKPPKTSGGEIPNGEEDY